MTVELCLVIAFFTLKIIFQLYIVSVWSMVRVAQRHLAAAGSYCATYKCCHSQETASVGRKLPSKQHVSKGVSYLLAFRFIHLIFD